MAEHKLKFTLPLYSAEINVVVTESVVASVNKRKHTMKAFLEEHEETAGSVFYNNAMFHVFFRQRDLDMNLIAHELFHLTHRVSDWAALNFDSSHHEATAQIHGFVFDKVWTWLRTKGLATF